MRVAVVEALEVPGYDPAARFGIRVRTVGFIAGQANLSPPCVIAAIRLSSPQCLTQSSRFARLA